jgi:nitrogen fixation protein NifX
MKIAFASKDGVHVNEHFGWCQKFYIYTLTSDSYYFEKEVDSSQDIQDEVDKLEYKINSLDGADMVYVTQIGPKASMMVKSAGVLPVKSSTEDETIENTLKKLQEMINNNPPIWLLKILAKDSK